MLKTRLTELLSIRHPILNAGMGRETSPSMVAAVCRAGGFGILGASGREPEGIRQAIRAIRSATDAPFGVNLLIPYATEERFQVLIEEQVPAISLSFGDPAPFIRRAHSAGALVVHMVGTVYQAEQAAEAGVDVLVAQGVEAGGHVLSTGLGTLSLVPAVVAVAGGRPVVAAGGIVDGRGLAACLALGAEGVLCGTAFLATHEGSVVEPYKRALLEASSDETLLSNVPDVLEDNPSWPAGTRVRLLPTTFIRTWTGREDELRRRRHRLLARMHAASLTGDPDYLVVCAGQGVGRLSHLRSIAELIEEMVQEAEIVISTLPAGLGPDNRHALGG
jgi:nitronate monooxygenase